tara:strand:+ start:124 stop:423 length:300 start_codon:yes stop_codon:yes gene_type:complete
MFRHPKYYKELKKNSTLSKRSVTKNNSSHVDQEDQAAPGSLPALDPQSDQVISNAEATAASERAPGQGLKQKLQASSLESQASSKPEPSSGSQASSHKL